MSDPHLVYLFKLAKEQGFIISYTDVACISKCKTCPAAPACTYIGYSTTTREAWLANYRTFYSRANFQPSIKTILDQHPEFLL